MTLKKIATCTFLIAATTQAFQVSQPHTANMSISSSFVRPSSTSLYHGNMEQLEFKIFPDGRIEESVRGIKGGQCTKVTDEINVHLGKVVASTPTEEMFEEKVFLQETVTIDEENSSSSGWDGSSSW